MNILSALRSDKLMTLPFSRRRVVGKLLAIAVAVRLIPATFGFILVTRGLVAIWWR